MPFWPLPDRKAILEHTRDLFRDPNLPDEFTQVLILTGTPVIQITAWVGDVSEGKQFFEKRIYPLGWPVADETKKFPDGQSYWDVLQTSIQGPDKKNVARNNFYVTSVVTHDLSDEFVNEVVALVGEMPTSGCFIGFIALGGAVARVRNDDTAVANREGRFWVLIQAKWGEFGIAPANPEALAAEGEKCIAWCRKSYGRLHPLSQMPGYGTLPTSEEIDAKGDFRDLKQGFNPRDKQLSFYGNNLAKLSAIKAKYDPNNLFNVNANIQPVKQ